MRKYSIRLIRGISIVEFILAGNNKSHALRQAFRKVDDSFKYLSCELIQKNHS